MPANPGIMRVPPVPSGIDLSQRRLAPSLLQPQSRSKMADQLTLTPKAARALIFNALTGAGTTPDNARYLTEGVLDTELSGMTGHGFHWVPYYCQHVRSGKVNGRAKPSVKRASAVA